MTDNTLRALAPFRERAMSVINQVFGGEHHIDSLKWKDNVWSSCTFLTYEAQLSTFDFRTSRGSSLLLMTSTCGLPSAEAARGD